MKPKLILSFMAIIISINSYGQFSFGVSPGIGFNKAYFGYKINEKIVPYVGFQFFSVNFTYERSGERFDWDLNQVVSFTDKEIFRGNLYVPNIGVKYFILEKNKLQAYASLSFATPFVSGKYEYNEEEDKRFKEIINNTNIFGGEFGVGIEYFFDENFSIGGEFGIRYLYHKYSYTSSTYYYTTKYEYTYKYSLSPTFTKISLNYYF